MANIERTLSDTSRYIYGTTRLGDGSIPFTDRVAIAQAALDANVWIHTSHTYGDALKVLRAALDASGKPMPPSIFKIGWDAVDQVREVIQENLGPLGMERMEVGQLCLGGSLGEEFRVGGACYEGLNRLKGEGLVGRFVLETWPWTSNVPYDAIKAGLASRLVDGLIFYFNPLQRFVTNELWDLIVDKDVSFIAMRTVSGGDVHRMAGPDSSAPDYLKKRASQVAPIYDESGCSSWPEFCVRFVYGVSQVRATVGATSRREGLEAFIAASHDAKPLPEAIQQAVLKLQREWSDDHDRFAAPWSM